MCKFHFSYLFSNVIQNKRKYGLTLFFNIDLYFISNSVLCVFKLPKNKNTKKQTTLLKH